jgi:hypothetical protein
MAMRVKPDTGEVGLKQRYRATNWSEYDRALVNRGNLTIRFDEASIRDQWTPAPPVGRGKPGLYSESAIQTCLTIKGLFQLPYRATEGLIKPLMRLCQLDLPVPDHTQLPRRAAQLSVKIPRRPCKGPTHVVVDSTGLKIFGKGEWAEAVWREASLRVSGASRLSNAHRGTVRLHEVGKRRTGLKIPLAAGRNLQGHYRHRSDHHRLGDSETLPGLLNQAEVSSRLMGPTTATAAMQRLPNGTRMPPSCTVTERLRGETTTRATPFSRRLKSRD